MEEHGMNTHIQPSEATNGSTGVFLKARNHKDKENRRTTTADLCELEKQTEVW